MPTNPGTTGLVEWFEADGGGALTGAHAGIVAAVGAGTCAERSGKVGGAADITGGDWLFVASPSTALQIDTSQDATFGCWALFDSAPSNAYPFCRWDGGGDWGLTVSSGGVATALIADGGGGANKAVSSGAGAVGTGSWHFLAGVFEGTAGAGGIGRIALYLDGASIGTADLTTGHSSGGIRTFIGTLNAGGFGSMDGAADELFFYDRALSTDELDWLYNGGAGRSYADLTGGSAVASIVQAHGLYLGAPLGGG